MKTIIAVASLTMLTACVEPVMMSGTTYPPVDPSQVRMSFASTPNCAGAMEIGMIPQVGSNKYAQDRAMNAIRSQAAAKGANLVLLETRATSLLGDMLIDAVMFRCP